VLKVFKEPKERKELRVVFREPKELMEHKVPKALKEFRVV
jgi:hypothetical protein